MLYFHRIQVFEGDDVNKTSVSEECDSFHSWYFLNKGFKFQPNILNRRHDLLMMSENLSDFETLKVPIIVVLLLELVKVKL